MSQDEVFTYEYYLFFLVSDALLAGIVVASIIILCVLILIVISIFRPLWLPSWCCQGGCHSAEPPAPNMTAGGEIMMENKVKASTETNYGVTV